MRVDVRHLQPPHDVSILRVMYSPVVSIQEIVMALTEIQARNAKPDDRPYPLAAGKGLRLLVNPNGSKLWQHRYRFEGKAKMLSYGSYPVVTVKEAGAKRDESRKLLANGVDPSAARKIAKRESRVRAANTFEVIAREWVEACLLYTSDAADE